MESEVQNNNTESQQDLEATELNFGDSSSNKKDDDNKADDNVESSSSTGSDGGKEGGGSGSGGGYSADCSSSDNSSLEAVKGGVPDKEMARLTVNGDRKSIPEPSSKESKSNKNSTQKTQKGLRRGNDQSEEVGSPDLPSQEMESDVDSQWNVENMDALHKESLLPQWNGVRVRHPMDPRIDISTVGIQHAALPATDLPENSQPQSEEKDSEGDIPSSSDPPPPPSIDQYMKLMEVVRPFFHAHGISHDGLAHATKSDDLSNERPSSDFATEPSDSDQKRSGSKLKVPVATWEVAHPTSTAPTAAAAPAASYPPARKRDPHESDSSSMVVLARVKKKHLKRTGEDSGNDGSNNSTNDSTNSSSSSSNRRVDVQQQQPDRREEIDPPNGEGESASNEDESNDNSGEADDSAGPQAGHQQESTSASSSEGHNNQAGEAAPRRYGVPAVVSEYSSSRTGSSGASNNNMMSTSGSGSGGNTGSGTGSGTASGSNQGSGNDQGISSNGIGSSGSGNDVKGSSEETMENSGENNSGENSGGNSDSSKNNRKEKKAGSVPADVPHVSSSHHRHTSNPPKDTASRDTTVQPQQKKPRLDEDKNAVREKKLQDKKRKRMNMRREYEEKIKDLESSESSRDRGEVAIKPGRPVTLDKVLSFTKIPRIVIKEGPPFLVVYTNAAYCRLTGVDSHVAVGKPISSLLSIPEGELVADTGANAGSAPSQNPAAGAAKEAGDGMDVDQNNNQIMPDGANNADGSNTFAAEDAANRARPTSQDGNTEMCLERLVAASGFGRCHVINVRTRSRPMIGRNVSIAKPASAASTRNREEGGFGSALATSGHEWSHNTLPCSMSVSPVVSSPEAFNVAAVVTDKDQAESHHHKSKRRKHHHHNDTQPAGGHHQTRRNHMLREVSMHRRRHLITHFVIQLEPFEGGFRENGAADSRSSTTCTTVEANILGLTKSELRRQRLRASHAYSHIDEMNRQHQGDDIDEMESESTDAKEPVTAIG